ncbi:MAG: endonuclease MutS2 [Thermaerobacter sp.]|nr:endonuclease MutS2 [Thermaerobacter sp.]
MDARSLRLLELSAVLERLAGRCDTALGKERALELAPEEDALRVTWRLLRTDEARRLLSRLGGVPIGGVRDLRQILDRVERGGSLLAAELAQVEQSLSAMRRTRIALLAGREDWPALAEDAELLCDLPALEERLARSIGPEGVLDDASAELARLRRERRRLEQTVRSRLDALLRNPDLGRYLQEPLVTVRAGRFCVPVLREHQSRIPGVVHDASQTGQTLFIEPMFALELGNEAQAVLRQALMEEERILRELSDLVAQTADALGAGIEAAAQVDLALGLGRLAEEMRAVRPEILEEPGLHLKQARHPLLADPVPITVELSRARRLLVITGPNTGGKTVSLKTVGLLQLMAQCGMHVPAAEGSTLAVCREVLCDVGDEQSIEQSLSTFSSHLTAIIRILQHLGPGSLVLLDELGAGTDPQEGAALAQAILERIAAAGGLGMVTTHYGELKAFAYAADGVENASMAFDPESLQPTYRLVQGAPGSSYAFVIAERLGLDPELGARARELMGAQRLALEDVLQRVDRLRQKLERELAQAEASARLAQAEEEQLRAAREAAARDRDEQRVQLRARISEDLASAKREIRAAREELRRERLHERREDALRDARSRLEALEQSLNEEGPPAPDPGDAVESVAPGEHVLVPQVGQEGVVLTVPDAEGRLWVAVGALRLRVALEELRVPRRSRRKEKEKPAPSSGWSAIAQEKARDISTEITLIGMRAEEALITLDRYLDDAEVAGLKTVRIIHGKGTGALRKAVHEFLQGDRRVAGHRLGAQGEGGVGATVVELQ